MSTFNTYDFRNSTIIRINFEKDVIDISPEYQRQGGIWNLEKRTLFIDSILNDYDIPKIYFYVVPRKKGANYQYAIVDGRQRMETIWGFMDGNFSVADDFVYLKDKSVKVAGFTYQDIAKEYPKLKILFDSFVLPIVCIETDDFDFIEDMFSRLNEAVPLNSAEKRNAFGGQMVKMINKVSEDVLFDKKVKFSNRRYQRKEIAVKLLYLEHGLVGAKKISDTTKPSLDYFVKQYRRKPNYSLKLARRVIGTIAKMSEVFADDDNLLTAQSAIPIYYLLFREAIKRNKISSVRRSGFIDFANAIAENRKIAEQELADADFDLLEYDRMSQQGANYAPSIRERFNIICKYFKIK